jgi:hypothetical protein
LAVDYEKRVRRYQVPGYITFTILERFEDARTSKLSFFKNCYRHNKKYKMDIITKMTKQSQNKPHFDSIELLPDIKSFSGQQVEHDPCKKISSKAVPLQMKRGR